MAYNPKTSRRKNMRLKGYDYSRPGAYFVTVCVKEHKMLFGNIRNGTTHLSSCGHIVTDTWEELPGHFPYVALDDYVVMPNHIHAILVINGDPQVLQTISGKPKPLGQLVAAFKTMATRRINEHIKTPGQPLWQRNFWERVIRNNEELNRIREYILYNPSRWEVDKLNPHAKLRMNESITNRQDVEWQG